MLVFEFHDEQTATDFVIVIFFASHTIRINEKIQFPILQRILLKEAQINMLANCFLIVIFASCAWGYIYPGICIESVSILF